MAGFWDTLGSVFGSSGIDDQDKRETLKDIKNKTDPKELANIARDPDRSEDEQTVAKDTLRKLVQSGGSPTPTPAAGPIAETPSEEPDNYSATEDYPTSLRTRVQRFSPEKMKTTTISNQLPSSTELPPPDFLNPDKQEAQLGRIRNILGNSPVTKSQANEQLAQNPTPFAPDYTPTTAQMESKLNAPVLEETDRQKYNQRRGEARSALDQNTSNNDWAQVAEMFGHALTQLGAGIYGNKNKVDLSKLDLKGVNWDRRRDQLLESHKQLVDELNREEDKSDKDVNKINDLKIEANKTQKEAELAQMLKNQTMQNEDYQARLKAGTKTTHEENIPEEESTTITDKDIDPATLEKAKAKNQIPADVRDVLIDTPAHLKDLNQIQQDLRSNLNLVSKAKQKFSSLADMNSDQADLENRLNRAAYGMAATMHGKRVSKDEAKAYRGTLPKLGPEMDPGIADKQLEARKQEVIEKYKSRYDEMKRQGKDVSGLIPPAQLTSSSGSTKRMQDPSTGKLYDIPTSELSKYPNLIEAK